MTTKPNPAQAANAIVAGWLAGLTEDQQAIISVWDQRALEDLVHAALDGDLAFAEQILSEEESRAFVQQQLEAELDPDDFELGGTGRRAGSWAPKEDEDDDQA